MSIHSVLHIAKMTGVAGMENQLLTLLPGLKARGMDARLLILTEGAHPMDEYAAQMEAHGVPTSQIPISRDLDINLFRRLQTEIRNSSCEAVHTHLIHADLHGVVAARRAGIKAVFMTGHNDDPFRRKLPIQMVQRYLWRQVTRGIAISDALRHFMIKSEGASPDKVVTVHYGLDVNQVQVGEGARAVTRAELGLPPQAPVIGSVCRLIEQKGISDALRAFWQVSRQVPDAHYVIVGDGPLRAELEHEVEGYGIGHRVHFLGWRNDAQMLMAAFDALLVPSRWEGFGLVVLEAMAVRLPIIATKVSALPEIVVNGQTGYLSPVADVQALSQSMIDVCMYPAHAHELGLAGRVRLETEFSVDKMIDATLKVYNDQP